MIVVLVVILCTLFYFWLHPIYISTKETFGDIKNKFKHELLWNNPTRYSLYPYYWYYHLEYSPYI